MSNTQFDMIGEARRAQWTPPKPSADSLRAIAPAKVNLFLDIQGIREDGYHNLTTVMQALSLHDTLHFALVGEDRLHEFLDAESTARAGKDGCIGVAIRIVDRSAQAHGMTSSSVGATNIPTEENLIFKAIDSFARKYHLADRMGLDVSVEKHIPMQAGLGGGSSDCAATLLAMQRLFGIGDSGDKDGLLDLAASLGADVSFFLHGGCALMEGTGARFEHALKPASSPVVIVKPPCGVSTREAYRQFDSNPEVIPASMLDMARSATEAEEVPLCNNLASAACELEPVLLEVAQWLSAQPISEEPLLCGSGAATFAKAQTFSDASKIAAAAQLKGWWARATTFSSLGAAVSGGTGQEAAKGTIGGEGASA